MNMETSFAINLNTRAIFLRFLEGYSLEQLNQIPDGFSNNLIWNINHCIATQQLLVYKLSGLPLLVDENFVELYKKGTKPVHKITEVDLNQTKEYLTSIVLKTKADFEAGIFKDFTAYPTSTGFVIESVEAALEFNNFHEGLHLGIIMQIKKFLH